ncbi:hexose kinase [Buchananella hordeovulneris]|uniref:hexose kinase n=1 Tax=Buchananella hordeovulneris TaxID=52770 RepID=UPI000F5DD8EB|nr:hexose kinase [Buchananella hordeovulneris]MDO5079939.1 hexose kinase [Buchananella hordeovulneris]RRD42848.1 1-phosphofructokinase [Buchananella hordeovulneris]
MILTVTPNPSEDRTLQLDSALVPGDVHRVQAVISQPGGKGINVARVLTGAGLEALALLPAAAADPIVGGLSEIGLPYVLAPAAGPARLNLTVSSPDGQTTKLNGAGAPATASTTAALRAEITRRLPGLTWLVLAGSLPPGMDPAWYADVSAEATAAGVKVALDTSDAPLRALAPRLPAAAPHLLKPNTFELAQLTDADPTSLDQAASAGDPLPVAQVARRLVDQGVGAVLATLGGAGAVLVTPEGAWFATSPDVEVRSTVGAGDSSLAGYLIAESAAADAPARLRSAVAYGAAAAALPGTGLPTPELTAPEDSTVTHLF